MGRLRFLTAGESHGPALSATIEGIPAGLPSLPMRLPWIWRVDSAATAAELAAPPSSRTGPRSWPAFATG
jgi:hypothetical protein